MNIFRVFYATPKMRIQYQRFFGAPCRIRTCDPRFRNAWVCGYESQRVTSFCLFAIFILQRVYENGLKTRFFNLQDWNEKEINFYINFAFGFEVLGYYIFSLVKASCSNLTDSLCLPILWASSPSWHNFPIPNFFYRWLSFFHISCL